MIYLNILIEVIKIIIQLTMKKGFFKKAFIVLKYLIEEWDIIYPLIKELIDEIKEQDKNEKSSV